MQTSPCSRWQPHFAFLQLSKVAFLLCNWILNGMIDGFAFLCFNWAFNAGNFSPTVKPFKCYFTYSLNRNEPNFLDFFGSIMATSISSMKLLLLQWYVCYPTLDISISFTGLCLSSTQVFVAFSKGKISVPSGIWTWILLIYKPSITVGPTALIVWQIVRAPKTEMIFIEDNVLCNHSSWALARKEHRAQVSFIW